MEASRKIRCVMWFGKWGGKDFPENATYREHHRFSIFSDFHWVILGWRNNRTLLSENRNVVGEISQTSGECEILIQQPKVTLEVSAIAQNLNRGPSLCSLSAINCIANVAPILGCPQIQFLKLHRFGKRGGMTTKLRCERYFGFILPPRILSTAFLPTYVQWLWSLCSSKKKIRIESFLLLLGLTFISPKKKQQRKCQNGSRAFPLQVEDPCSILLIPYSLLGCKEQSLTVQSDNPWAPLGVAQKQKQRE